MTDPIERVPPQSIDAEVALLGAILCDGTAILKAEEIVTPQDFYSTANRRIYEACKRVVDNGDKPDYVTVAEELRKGGTPEYVDELLKLPILETWVNVDVYATEVHDKANRRAYLYEIESMRSVLYTGTDTEIAFHRERISSMNGAVVKPHGWLRVEELIAKPYVAPPHFWPDVIVDKWVTLFVGEAKAGKTFLLYAFLKAFTETGMFLGRKLPGERGRVVYVSEEPESIIHWRLLKFGVRQHVVILPSGESMRRPWDTLNEEAGKMAKDEGASIIVFDTLAALAGIKKENDNSEVADNMRTPRRTAAKYGVSVVCVHHAGRQSKDGGPIHARGASAFDGAADIIASLSLIGQDREDTKREFESHGRLEPGHGRTEIIEFQAGETALYTTLGLKEDVKKGRENTKMLAAMRVLLDEGTPWPTAKQVDSVAGTTAARNALATMYDSKQIQRRGRASTGYSYALPGVALEVENAPKRG